MPPHPGFPTEIAVVDWPPVNRVCWIVPGLLSGFLLVSGCDRFRKEEPAKAVPVREDGAIDLTLMSFNVRYENPAESGDRAWSQRVIGCVRMIRRERPDIIGVQEVLHGQAADLRASLPDYGFIGDGREDGKKAGEYAGIFYEKTRLRADPEDRGMFWLSSSPEVPGSKTWGNEYPRVTTWIRLVDQSTQRGFYVFNTHWDHRNQPSREQAALLIARKIDGRKRPNEPVVLIGDFNSLETNPGISYLTGKRSSLAGSSAIWANGLVDAYQSLHAAEKNRRTLHLWRNTRDGSLKVDHIFFSKGGRVRSADIVTGDSPMISDHFPVTARILFPKGG